MGYKNFDLEPVAAEIGAEVIGLDLSKPLEDAVRQELHDAWLEYQILFVEDQTLSPADLKHFASIFGDFEDLPFLTKHEDDPDVAVLTSPNTFEPSVNRLHIDVSYKEIPSKGAVLYAFDVPDAGGDTIWASAYAAYEGLSPPMQQLVEGLTGTFPTLDQSFVDYFVKMGPKALNFVNQSVKSKPVVHPLVKKHPETGRKALFVDSLRMWSINELSDEESHGLMDILDRHVAKPEYQCRHHWKQGSVAVWDNRCTLHRRVNDMGQNKRVLHRVGLV